MPINCLVNQRDKETKRQKDKETKRGALPQPLPKGKGFVAALMHRTWGSFLESKRGRVGEGKAKENYGKAKENYGKARKNYGKAKKNYGKARKNYGKAKKN